MYSFICSCLAELMMCYYLLGTTKKWILLVVLCIVLYLILTFATWTQFSDLSTDRLLLVRVALLEVNRLYMW